MATTATVQQTKWWNGGKSPFNLEYGKLMMWYFLMSDAFTFGAFLISYGTIRFSQNFWPDPNVVFNAFPGAGHANLPLAFVSVMTFILIISSVTMVLAVHAGHNNNKKEVAKWLVWTIIGGAAFLGCQAWEWHHLITGEHAVLVDGQLGIVGQTTRINPWGDLASSTDITAAIQNTPREILERLAHMGGHGNEGAAPVNYAALPNEALIKLIDFEGLHIRENGPVAFGGYFFGITGFHGFHVFSGVIINIIILLGVISGTYQKRGHYEMVEKTGLYWHFVDLVWVFVFTFFYLV